MAFLHWFDGRIIGVFRAIGVHNLTYLTRRRKDHAQIAKVIEFSCSWTKRIGASCAIIWTPPPKTARGWRIRRG
jgi:hypothetical protein